jgi:hypothetical protein
MGTVMSRLSRPVRRSAVRWAPSSRSLAIHRMAIHRSHILENGRQTRYWFEPRGPREEYEVTVDASAIPAA